MMSCGPLSINGIVNKFTFTDKYTYTLYWVPEYATFDIYHANIIVVKHKVQHAALLLDSWQYMRTLERLSVYSTIIVNS